MKRKNIANKLSKIIDEMQTKKVRKIEVDFELILACFVEVSDIAKTQTEKEILYYSILRKSKNLNNALEKAIQEIMQGNTSLIENKAIMAFLNEVVAKTY